MKIFSGWPLTIILLLEIFHHCHSDLLCLVHHLFHLLKGNVNAKGFHGGMLFLRRHFLMTSMTMSMSVHGLVGPPLLHECPDQFSLVRIRLFKLVQHVLFDFLLDLFLVFSWQVLAICLCLGDHFLYSLMSLVHLSLKLIKSHVNTEGIHCCQQLVEVRLAMISMSTMSTMTTMTAMTAMTMPVHGLIGLPFLHECPHQFSLVGIRLLKLVQHLLFHVLLDLFLVFSRQFLAICLSLSDLFQDSLMGLIHFGLKLIKRDVNAECLHCFKQLLKVMPMSTLLPVTLTFTISVVVFLPWRHFVSTIGIPHPVSEASFLSFSVKGHTPVLHPVPDVIHIQVTTCISTRLETISFLLWLFLGASSSIFLRVFLHEVLDQVIVLILTLLFQTDDGLLVKHAIHAIEVSRTTKTKASKTSHAWHVWHARHHGGSSVTEWWHVHIPHTLDLHSFVTFVSSSTSSSSSSSWPFRRLLLSGQSRGQAQAQGEAQDCGPHVDCSWLVVQLRTECCSN